MKEKNTGEITNKVYEYRVLRRMTQKELADLVGVSRQTIVMLEKNKYTPSLLLAFKIASYFNEEITNLFFYHGKGEVHND